MDWLRDYTPSDGADAINRATVLFKTRDVLWQLPFVLALTDLESTHAVVWDEQCVRRLLPLTHTPNRDALMQDMQMLSELRARLATRDEFGTCARRIWYRNSSRDQFQTAVAQLYAAVASQLYPGDARTITLLGVGVTLIAQGEGFPNWVMSIATEEFEFVEQQRKAGTLPSQILNLAGADHYGLQPRKAPND